MTAQPSRPGITPVQINAVVAEFYAKIRLHPTLGPIFAAHVTDWPAHEDKIARFWRNAILQERSYDAVSYTHLDVYKRQPQARWRDSTQSGRASIIECSRLRPVCGVHVTSWLIEFSARLRIVSP